MKKSILFALLLLGAMAAAAQPKNNRCSFPWGVHLWDKDNSVVDTTQLIVEYAFCADDLAAEDNYNNMTATNRHAWFGDAKIKYKTRTLDYELELNNLINQRQYTRTTYSGPDIFTTTTSLRPLNVLLKVRFKLL